ncbi:MAG: hypothetical protein H0V44_18065 [Planctomycetes bacterium]|nr:hypothetical protein [Planctomycetota bacterium]
MRRAPESSTTTTTTSQPAPRSPELDPERVLDDARDRSIGDDPFVSVSESDAEEMASGSVREQLLYQKGLAENRIDDDAPTVARAKGPRSKAKPAKSPSKAGTRGGHAAPRGRQSPGPQSNSRPVKSGRAKARKHR